MRKFLHVGSGPNTKEMTTNGFRSDTWTEIRLDIDPTVRPDIIGTMTDMSAISDGSIDAIFSSHNIEHLYIHEIPVALSEFLRVLKPEGFAVITCPDLQSVCALIAEDKLTEPAYESPAGPIAPLDILYGHRPAMAAGNLFMAHRSGFTKKVLLATLIDAGFKNAGAKQREEFYDLWAIATKQTLGKQLLQDLAEKHFPS